MTPRAEATDELVESLAKASWDASDGFVTSIPWPPNGGFRADKERRRVRAVLAVLNGDFPYVGQRVEWNPADESWLPGIVSAVNGALVRVLLGEGEYVNVDRKHLRVSGVSL